MVSAHLEPSKTPPGTFQVYKLISSLRSYEKHPLLLPANGLTVVDAKHIGILTYSLFAMMDLTDAFEDRKVWASIFGHGFVLGATYPIIRWYMAYGHNLLVRHPTIG
jgi:hypothetical protein